MTFTKPFSEVESYLSGVDAPVDEVTVALVEIEVPSNQIVESVQSACVDPEHLLHGAEVTVVFPCLNRNAPSDSVSHVPLKHASCRD